MKKILLLLVFLFTISCSTTEEILPGFVPDFITNYFKDEVLPYKELPEFISETKIDLIWTNSFPGEIKNKDSFLNLYRLDDDIYIPTNENKVHIVSLESGNLKKSIDIELDIFSGIIVDSNLIYFGSKQDTVTALKHADGSVLWQRLMSSEIMSISRSIYDNAIYIRTNDSKIVAIDVTTGKFLWANSQSPESLSIRGASGALIDDDKVYVGYDGGKIVAYNSLSGDLVWQVKLQAIKTETVIDRLNDIDGSMIIDNGVLFAISYQGSIAAIDSFSGQVLWTREASSLYGLEENDDNIFYIDDAGILWCLDKVSGRPVWKQEELFKRLTGEPVLYNNFIIARDIENYLHIMSPDDGKLIGRIKTKNQIQSIYSDFSSLYFLEKDFSLKRYEINKILKE